MKKYLLGLLELRKKELTNRLNQLENEYRSASASGLSGYSASVKEVRKEMEKLEAYKKKLQDMEMDGNEQ